MTENQPKPVATGTARRLSMIRYVFYALLLLNGLLLAGVPFGEAQRRLVESVARANSAGKSKHSQDPMAIAAAVMPPKQIKKDVTAESKTAAGVKSDVAIKKPASDIELEQQAPKIENLDQLIAILDDDPDEPKTVDTQSPSQLEETIQPTENIVSRPVPVPDESSADDMIETIDQDKASLEIDTPPSQEPDKRLPQLAQSPWNFLAEAVRNYQLTGEKNPDPPKVKILSLTNPRPWNTTIRFAIDGEVLTLHPGETLDFDGDRRHCIQFHCGGDFGTAEHLFSTGDYRFEPTEHGWTLVSQAAKPGA